MSLYIALAVVLTVVTVAFLLRGRVIQPITVRIDQIPAVVAQLAKTGKDESFAVLQFAGRRANDDDTDPVELQFSIEAGRPGLDWVLIAPRNLAEKERIANFIRDHGHAVNEKTANDVRYLRVEDGNLADLGIAIARDGFGLASTQAVEMIVEDFDWPPADRH